MKSCCTNKKPQSQWLTTAISCSCCMLAAAEQLQVSSTFPPIPVPKLKEQLPGGTCCSHGRGKGKRASRYTQWLLKVLLRHDNFPICSHAIDQSKSHDKAQCQKSWGAYSSWREHFLQVTRDVTIWEQVYSLPQCFIQLSNHIFQTIANKNRSTKHYSSLFLIY